MFTLAYDIKLAQIITYTNRLLHVAYAEHDVNNNTHNAPSINNNDNNI